MINKKLSIITINLNNNLGLKKTIDSVLSQEFKDFEFIIVDGGSKDGSLDLIKDNSAKITSWISEPDTGIYNAMNKGILIAQGEYLQFLNSGDCLVEATTLEKIFNSHRSADILYGNINNVSCSRIITYKVPEANNISLNYFFNNTIPHPAAFIARRLFQESLYDEKYKFAADKKFFIEKIIKGNCTLEYFDQMIVNFDTRGISSRNGFSNPIRNEEISIFSELFPPRVLIDYHFFRTYNRDINYLVRIKKKKLLYM
jgi:glycosyltransferase involved in cell wall biosynthesis